MNEQMDGQERDMMFILDRFMNEVLLGWIQQKKLKASDRFFALHIFLSNKNKPTSATTTATATTTGCV
jgi:hypothetical protein